MIMEDIISKLNAVEAKINKLEQTETISGAGSINLYGDISMTGSILTSEPVQCRLASSATQSISNNSWTALTYDTEGADDFSMFSTSYPSRVVLPGAGVYLVSAYVSFATNTTGTRGMGIRFNGSSWMALDTRPAVTTAGPTFMTIQGVVPYVNSGDYIEIHVYQDSGGSLSTQTTSMWTRLVVVRIA